MLVFEQLSRADDEGWKCVRKVASPTGNLFEPLLMLLKHLWQRSAKKSGGMSCWDSEETDDNVVRLRLFYSIN